jgi:hypothetical protein
MYERLDPEGPLSTAMPFPLNELPAEGPLDSLVAQSIIGALLQQSAGLAGTIYGASLHPETCQQDLAQSAHILAEWLSVTLAIWRRWEEAQEAGA